MKIRILGAHNLQSRRSRYLSILIDGILALDAGSLTSALSFPEQERIQAVLLTHQHYDHIRDIPSLAINFMALKRTVDLYAPAPVREAIAGHLLNGILYPRFLDSPAGNPPVRLQPIDAGRTYPIAGYEVTGIPVNHAVPTIGFQIKSPGGKSLFYTSDTGPGLADCWGQVHPDLLITEVTLLEKYRDFAYQSGHLTASLLKNELLKIRESQGYVPQVLLVHLNPIDEREIRAEIGRVARELHTKISIAREGMQFEL